MIINIVIIISIMLLRNAVPLQIVFVTGLVLTSRPITRQSDAQVCDHCMCSYRRIALNYDLIAFK